MRIFIAALFTMQACLAQAQTPQTTPETTESKPTESYQLQKVEILGNKEDKSYLESTESISVLQAETYDKGVKTDSIKALNALPNVQVTKNDNTFSIRGINNIGVTGYQKDNLASIMVDDVFQTDLAISAGAFDFWDLDHVEIYRGAQSTTQGVNSLAGNILLFHRKASEQTEGAAKAGVGTYGYKEIGAVTNNTMLDKKILTRVAVNVERYDGFIDNVTTGNDRWGRQDKNYISGDMIYKINAFDEIRWNLKVMQTENGGTYSQSTNPFDYHVYEDVDNRTLTNNQQTSLRYTQKINENSSNETILAYSQSDQDATADADGTSSNTAGVRYEDHTDNYLSVENLYKYQSEKIKNVLGLHFHDYTIKDDYNFNVLAPGPVPVRQKTEKYQDTYAIFDSMLYKFNESHAMNLGLRYEYMKNKFDSYIVYGTTRTANGNEEGGILLPKIGYVFSHGISSYGVSYTQGYRTGGVSVNRWTSNVSQYDPETTHNFELSYKCVQDQLKVAANVFYTHWVDQQVLIQYAANNPYNSATVNAASSEVYGAELEAQYTINPQNLLGMGVGYNHTKFIDFKGPLNQNYDGNEFPFASPWTGSVNYVFKPTDNWAWDTTLRYLAQSYSDAANTSAKRAPEQFYLDTSLAYLIAPISLNVETYIRNVLDQKYVTYDASNAFYGTKVYQVNSPREFGARVTYFW
ncbi:TonB-dependent receptor [Bdellovibrio sp. SKB1291214]|uniref:TonB-dependent receptor n=1 Tax=Bdellovibrio sp. SKB1291214 TaxID=1732569 RepID=UPI000B51CE92|nr:TonB-dependent receptor [Bdellovibrio sp. SKB1291214]UYL07617.1 TonB-dependent receptor [Bdellovibrio sp. SKB1291214]